jgi:hypothetical protein
MRMQVGGLLERIAGELGILREAIVIKKGFPPRAV